MANYIKCDIHKPKAMCVQCKADYGRRGFVLWVRDLQAVGQQQQTCNADFEGPGFVLYVQGLTG